MGDQSLSLSLLRKKVLNKELIEVVRAKKKREEREESRFFV